MDSKEWIDLNQISMQYVNNKRIATQYKSQGTIDKMQAVYDGVRAEVFYHINEGNRGHKQILLDSYLAKIREML